MNQVEFISKALISLYDNDWETCSSNIDEITWKDGHITTLEEKNNIITKVAEFQAEYDNKEYQRKRSIEYPSIVDQLDKIFHDGIDAWKEEIQAIKDKYPKA